MSKIRGLLLGAAAFVASGAHATNYSIAGLAVPTMTYQTVAGVTANLTSAYSGVGSLFVTTQSSATTGLGFLCTGSLLNATTVLTAGHCLYDHDESTGASDPLTSITFFLPSFGDRNSPTVEKYTATQYEYNPLYDNATDLPDGTPAHTGDIGSGHDVALFTLSKAATGHDTYSLYAGNPLAQYTEVGTGTTGGPKGTNQGVTSDYKKRAGSNVFELYGDDLFDDVSHGVVLSDFDDGTAAHDVFGRNLGLNQTGVAGEADSSPGDSGGPEFINGQIASVTSFGITGAIFDGFCGGTGTDPYNNSGKATKTTDLSQCTNSSVGEIAGDTLTSYNTDFISSYLAGTASPVALPEPATWAELVLGFGLIGAASRSTRRKATA